MTERRETRTARTRQRARATRAARWLCEEAQRRRRVAGGFAGGARRAGDASGWSPISTRWSPAHLAGEPLAYVLGHWSFRHLDLAVDRRVLIPRPETEVVAGVAIELARRLPRPLTVADLGTGSGAIGLSLADELPVDGVTVWLTDASADALDVARANLAGIGRRGANVRIATGSWFDALPPGTAARRRRRQPAVRRRRLADSSTTRSAIGSRTRRSVRRRRRSRRHPGLIAAAPGWVRPGGWLVLEIGADQGTAVADAARRRAATPTSRSAPTSPAATASPSPS